MGYTHYMSFKSSHGNTDKIEKLYQAAIKDCNFLISDYYEKNKGTENSLSGYSAHCGGKYGGINVNGKGSNSHETFVIREHYNQNEGFNFCKTTYKPYDIVVVSCLSILKHYLGSYVDVSSDGDFEDWIDGVEYVNSLFDYNVNNPIFKQVQSV